MTDDTTPEQQPSDGLDDLIAEAAAQAAEQPDAEPSDDGPADDQPVEVPASQAADATPAADEATQSQVDWEALGELDERSKGELLAELTATTVARDSYLDSLQRKQAEYDNFRKRTQRDAASMRITGHVEVANRLLDVLDDFDRVIDNAGDVDETFLKGVTLVHDKLAAQLVEVGLSRIDEVGVDFDPNRHEAVQQIASDEELDEPQVTEVYRAGYEMAGRVLRAAMVVVKQ